ncbi:hypothetical protein BABINDRAFT_163376 [Babjeviella inositovora NRRL Y-12698]|uniref:Zn(2)-C6 fungal-type domain-containing protein n=1 Tax=Babjeviella inositovora NRRL Y-12698 TaxID=984486 RepID=A0A1E3QIY8_9ASCO|nr:uncharacterized protein BABINDRAFT_163376 [Babjeviella inositovora NRRL Y-12698]ODQ77661.1 hypothetical protein BABINDRAFT_163376 [Babjeviella inositovora NRRL Y-12698]
MSYPPEIAPKIKQEPSSMGVFSERAGYDSQSYDDYEHFEESDGRKKGKPPGHRPVTSCTFCRQHKIKCDASERAPLPCHRCEKMSLSCEIDPQFRPKKGSQMQSLREDVDELKSKLEYLQEKNEGLLSQVAAAPPVRGALIPNYDSTTDGYAVAPMIRHVSSTAETFLQREPSLVTSPDARPAKRASTAFNDSVPTNDRTTVDEPSKKFKPDTPEVFSEFVLGDVHLLLEKASSLHRKFITDYLPFLPILTSDSAAELYQQSQLLFWTVMLTACLSEPDPTIHRLLASLIKQLAIETCWIRTPRSTHIIQALIILSFWPLPNEKVLDDVAYRFVGLAKNLSLQLGLHRGKFISEFSRTQVALPNAEKWRTRSWLSVFFAEQFWSSNLGLPPLLETDYLLETARIDTELPKNFRCLISLAIFQSKLVSMMGSSVTSPDGLMEAKNRSGTLSILDRELERLAFKLQIDAPSVEIYFLYVKLMICCFAFLPGTPIEDQTKYVTDAYLASTRIVTILSKMIEQRQLIELPMYVRHPVSFAVLVLFRLHLTDLLEEKYVDSARQSIVTVHRLYRNMLSAWKDIQNDLSRTASVLEKLNYVIITCPELFTTHTDGIISRMRSHLTGSLFYDLIWCIHEARRRSLLPNKEKLVGGPPPLPFYNQITKDDFTTLTQTTPGGTTITTLVPTHQAMSQATHKATAAGLTKPTEINGIPIALLEATGSVNEKKSVLPTVSLQAADENSKGGYTAFPDVSDGVYPVVSSPGVSALLQSPQPVNHAHAPIAPAEHDTKGPVHLLNRVVSASPAFGQLLYPKQRASLFSRTPSVTNMNQGQFSQGLNMFNMGSNPPVELPELFDNFFQQQTLDNWNENGDDFLGWFDGSNMGPEF